MAGEWIDTTLGDICVLRAGSVFPPALQGKSTGAYPFAKVSDMNLGANAACIQDANNWVDDADLPQLKAKPFPIGTTVFAKIGEALKANRLRFLVRPTIIDNNMMGAVPIADTVDPRYFFFALSQFDFGEVAGGTALPYLTVGALSQLELSLPPIDEQRAIAHILGTLDDKIEVNRRMNETLEGMARALFQSWFVDFDPVRAKAEGRDPGLPKNIAELFPDGFEDSELGEIPRGWGVGLGGDLFEVAIGKTPPRKEHQWFSTDPQDIRWMSIRDLGQAGVFISEVSEYLTADAVERFRVRRIPDGTVVLSFKLTVGRVAITDGEMLSNEAIAHFVPRGTTFLSAAYLYCYLRQFDYDSLGSTSSIATAVNSDSVRAIPVLVPSAEVHEAFLSATLPSFFRLRALQRESRTLASLRDALLPKLISGELRVGDAARFVGAGA